MLLLTPHLLSQIADTTGPDDNLTGMAQRYLSAVMPDAAAPDLLADPQSARRSICPTSDFGILFSQLVHDQRLNDALSLKAISSAVWPQTDNHRQIKEQLAFALWTQREGNKLGEGPGVDRSMGRRATAP
jgi:hypothetical protein